MTTLNDYFTYTIAAHWLAPIFNADFTGLLDEEENQVARFLSEANNLPDATWQLPDDETHFAICEISGLFSDCHTVKLFFTNETLEA
jgi:hypothetical protein